MALRFLALVFLIACDNKPVELDPQWSVCDDVICDEVPRCKDGTAMCFACECCSCPTDHTFCDPERANVQWRCNGRCYIEESCPTFEVCETLADRSQCALHCELVHRGELQRHVCGDNDALCAECECWGCDDEDLDRCDDRPSGNDTYLLTCNVAAGCWEKVPCDGEARCVNAYYSNGTCLTPNDCDTLTGNCTNPPMCQPSPTDCGICGCCDVWEPFPVLVPLCWQMPDGRHAAFTPNDGVSPPCYDVQRCDADAICTYPFILPACVSAYP